MVNISSTKYRNKHRALVLKLKEISDIVNRSGLTGTELKNAQKKLVDLSKSIDVTNKSYKKDVMNVTGGTNKYFYEKYEKVKGKGLLSRKKNTFPRIVDMDSNLNVLIVRYKNVKAQSNEVNRKKKSNEAIAKTASVAEQARKRSEKEAKESNNKRKQEEANAAAAQKKLDNLQASLKNGVKKINNKLGKSSNSKKNKMN